MKLFVHKTETQVIYDFFASATILARFSHRNSVVAIAIDLQDSVNCQQFAGGKAEIEISPLVHIFII
jgi:hypothetical protein